MMAARSRTGILFGAARARHFPGGPEFDPATKSAGDFEYRWQHSMRSAQFVHEWLYRRDASDDLVGEVETLILLHEFGGDEAASVLQAADSLSFLEVNPKVLAGWFTSGRAGRERAKAQAQYMFERIRIERARELARPLYEEALAVVDRA